MASLSHSDSLSDASYSKKSNSAHSHYASLPPAAVSRDEGSPPDRSVPDTPLEIPFVRPTGEKINPSHTPQIEQDIDGDDPFDLKDQAKEWLENELATYKAVDADSTCYVPFDASLNRGEIPISHWDKAYAEFCRRFVQDKSSTGPSVLLVATGVDKDWKPGEDLRKAKYLFFPNIDNDGITTSALFITYMPGAEHGAADAYVHGEIAHWMFSNDLDEVLNGGLSSGDYGESQPDCRIFPMFENRDHHGDDIDKKNGGAPYSRLIWEVEWKNRNPLDMRKNGKVLMQSPYNRLYLAAKIYGFDEDGETEAAIALWGRDKDSDGIKVIKAVSFGTIDLSCEHKQEFARVDRKSLVGVPIDQWQRPSNLPTNFPYKGQTPEELVLNIPLHGLLYKTMYQMGPEDTPRYLNELRDKDILSVTDLKIDLRKLLKSVVGLAARKSGSSTPLSKKPKIE